ncbi:MAG: hypothetical protein IKW92_00005 [Firmicutes bacterium]|nr:hypothetical protein [Bacillota bacterium]
MDPLNSALIAVLSGAVAFAIEYIVSRNVQNRFIRACPLILVLLLNIAFIVDSIRLYSAAGSDWDRDWVLLAVLILGIIPIGISLGWLIGWSMGKEDQKEDRTTVAKRILAIAAGLLLVIGVLNLMQ